MGPLPKSIAGFNPPCSRFDAACQAPLSSYIKVYYDELLAAPLSDQLRTLGHALASALRDRERGRT
jgi:hypothetical protein